MSEKLLEINNLEKTFPGVRALKGVKLTVNKGEVHALMGENGAGKSTLIKVLTGIYQKDGGTILFDGEEINARTPIEANEKGISTIYQELNLVLFQTVYENLFLGREPRTKFGNIDRKKMIAEADRILGDLGIHIDVEKPLKAYSTAIQQMVAIARAISTNTKLVIMDEPTSSLDANEVQILFRIIRKLKNQGISVIFISHKLDEIFEICERLTVFKDGEYVGNYDVKELDQLKLISLMVGRDAVKLERKKEGYNFSKAEELMSVKGVKQGMRLNGIDIDIKQGEVVGLAGLLGSGRTELAQVIFGANAMDEGEIFWHGNSVKVNSPADAISKGMGYCTEDRKVEGIIPHLSVKENLTIALLPKISKFGFVNKKEQDRIVKQYIERLKIKTPTPEQAICNLSGGNQQKVLLARWMCMNPKLIIMDEPTRGIDVGAKAEIEQLIQELSDNGISVLMISSEIAELERNCDRIVVMREGKKIGELVGDSISYEKVMETIAKGSSREVQSNVKG
ncbi:ribose transport system ATP-binding protein [Anaerosporobacter mobilis DSM 15930]|jgi:ABC-type sugar transport system ATPase subunit|uniref:Ribose transport system ATP-binding protein n=2 Tax=Anaerosporobacter TaxID=653683 RepID=A0A1M7MCP5_9FIRM|nr:sugar ABC transporter ATP-binding protein [Anaerosporobacter mobilis]SHM88117.1 ribose transport system ATP-binding protein [Anaerosporobacter mobilis DSM 15930]